MRVPRWPRFRSKRAIVLWLLLAVTAGPWLLWTMDAAVRARLHDGTLTTPTRFYARPIVLRRDTPVDESRLDRTLERLGYERTRRRGVRLGEYRRSRDTWTIGRRAFRHFEQFDPGGTVSVRLGWGNRVERITDADGRRLDDLILEPELLTLRFGEDREDRIPVPLEAVPRHLIEAIIAVEDRRFFDHHGLDLRRIVGAALANVRAKHIVEGASTITQQLARNLYLTRKRSLIRKAREAVMAVTLEARHTKEEILEAYLNEVYLGQDGAVAIHGVGRASQFYFRKDVSQLDLHESALLAGLIRGPSMYSPMRHRKAAKDRRNLVLSMMLDRGVLEEDEHRRARSASVRVRAQPDRSRSGRYVADFVAGRLAAEHGRKTVDRGLVVFTTVDMELQQLAERAVSEELRRLERMYPRLTRGEDQLQAALVALDTETGEVLAMVGGRDYGTSQFNRAVLARRQPGSAFKPIVALAGLRERDVTLASLLDDEPLSVETPVGLWEPQNYDGRFRGSVTLRDALERSLNVPFARLGLEIGPRRVVETARDLGVRSPLRAVPSIALGALEVTPLEMAKAFGVLAASGYRADIQTTLGVFDARGSLISQFKPSGKQVVGPDEAYLVTSALQGAVERGTGRRLRSMGYYGSVAGKSGTTNDYRDAWFIGYTPNLAIAVWVGFDDGRSIGLSGSRAALPIFARFLIGSVGRNGEANFRMPRGVEVVEINEETGLLAGRGCRGDAEIFLRGTAPKESCSPYGRSSRYRRYTSSWNDDVEAWAEEIRRLARAPSWRSGLERD